MEVLLINRKGNLKLREEFAMQPDNENIYRSLFSDSSVGNFPDRVDAPWDKDIPDMEDFNLKAYRNICRQVDSIHLDPQHKSRGLLVLGAAGTGKTHLLMRVARTLSTEELNKDTLKSHILFVRRPNNEEAVAQHIWDNIVISMGQSLSKNSNRTQLDTMLSHVFSAVLIPGFKQDIAENKDSEKKERWKRQLEKDPYNLLKILGEGEQRNNNLNIIRRRTLNHLKTQCSDVDQDIAYVLITYCLTAEESRKRLLMEWLRGKEYRGK
ncbi:MAG: hypothetical protein FWC50_03635 [Planctomycetaceae bacterium]|nr:hypothetical protein [Planctomycetaceae bacterium]